MPTVLTWILGIMAVATIVGGIIFIHEDVGGGWFAFLQGCFFLCVVVSASKEEELWN